MSASAVAPPIEAGKSSAGTQEHKIIFLLCILAAIHVFIYSAAFPFFNNVDEPIHFDLVLKYSHAAIPRGPEKLSQDSAIYLSLYSSLAYFGAPDRLPGGKFPPPPWSQPPETVRQNLQINVPAWQTQDNYEVPQPPLYYALAGMWWDLGKRFGFHDEQLLYWLRWMNILVVVALVWIADATARLLFPQDYFVQFAVPLLVAFMPQTAFYSIENDVLSPLCCGIAFFCILKWFQKDPPNPRWAAAAGLAFAAAFLTKMSNIPILAVAAIFILFKTLQYFAGGKIRGELAALLAFSACAAPPIIVWMLWSKIHFGYFTGSKLITDHFGWTVKPFAEWWGHPIFSPRGLAIYLSGQLSSFWQGEFYWHNQPMTSPAANVIYATLSLLLPAAAVLALFRRSNGATSFQREALFFALIIFIALLGFYALLSIIYDFHNCPSPSRTHPYYVCGRLVLGGLIPFLLLFVYGLHCLLARFGNVLKFSVLTAMVLLMLASEMATNWPAFSNEFNWFHYQ